MNIIKRGSGYFHLSLNNLLFVDMINYLSPQSLSTFVKSWEIEEPKHIFPYDFFDSIESIVAQTKFPDYNAFKSKLKTEKNEKSITEYYSLCNKYGEAEMMELFDLKKDNITNDNFHVSPLAYFQTKEMYDSYFDAFVWGSFLDYLAFYNCSDVVIATLAFNKYTKSMKTKYE